jgi:iron complex transport system ATP-binding protein
MSLDARGLAIGFRDPPVVQGIDLSLAAGQVMCLLGPNGSGKTTLLRTLLGLLPPLAGEIRLDGEPIGAIRPADRARRIAYVPQASATDMDFTLRQVVEMGRAAHAGLFGRPSRQDRELSHATLERLGLGALADRAIARVSGGERQLAFIARALATEARTLLMDEPTANLDFSNQSRVLDEVAALRTQGRAVLFTTHHPDHALRIADVAILLRGGSVLAQGGAVSTLNSTNLSALYGRAIEVVEIPSNSRPPARVCVAR